MAMKPDPSLPHRHEDRADLWSGNTTQSAVSHSYLWDSNSFCSASSGGPSAGNRRFAVALAEFTGRWERGETPRAEDYFDRLDPDRPAEFAEMIYREFCLTESTGNAPERRGYFDRFPEYRDALNRLFSIHDAGLSLRLRRWANPLAPRLPEAGDEIGPYRLLHELGQGGFARVFLAEQADLDGRLVVLKVSARLSDEPWLLARSSHPHIVGVLGQAKVEDAGLHIITMPFLGGTTLARVLAEQRRTGIRPTTGSRLLADLDRASVPGYPAPGTSRPARGLIAGLSYSKAAGWVVARLAEALDYAYRRGVLHGDVKPSNILITADGSPMLLDFNLAVGWLPSSPLLGSDDAPADLGGTLPYMAPERLRVVASPVEAPRPSTAGRHRADIYSLGVVLFEALTGRSPELPGSKALSVQEMASAYVSSRQLGGDVMIRSARSAVPSGLRPILARCLASDPADRYSRASELAEDLDCWREDRPFVYAREPGPWVCLLRWVRRRHQAVTVAALGLTLVAVCGTYAWRWSEAEVIRRAWAASNDFQLHSGDSGAFLLRRPFGAVVNARVDPSEQAKRHLESYGVIGTGNWRLRDEFRGLPQLEREELEVWLLEQAIRFAHGLAARPEAPGDWLRALKCLERAAPPFSIGPIEAKARALRLQSRQANLAPPQTRANQPTRQLWMEDYLSGVEAELCDDLKTALKHYESVLNDRPRSFWASYRAAAIEFRLQEYAAAVDHLRECVDHRPESAVLRHQYASCLYGKGDYRSAEEQYDKAQSLDPDHAETYLSRAFLSARMRQPQNIVKEIRQFDVLQGWRDRSPSSPISLDLTTNRRVYGFADNSQPGHVHSDPDTTSARAQLAYELMDSGQDEMALEQFERVLKDDPDNIRAHFNRGIVLRRLHRDGVASEFALVAEHPRAATWIREYPDAIYAFLYVASSQIRQGRPDEALIVAKRAARFADLYQKLEAESHFTLARAYAHAAKENAGFRRLAVDELKKAKSVDRENRFDTWLASEQIFAGILEELGKPEPAEFKP